jgi:cytochrome c-type biogenesis protein
MVQLYLATSGASTHSHSSTMVYPHKRWKRSNRNTTAMAQRTVRLVQPGASAWQGFGFALLGLALGGLLIAAGSRVYGLEGAMSTVAGLLPVGYAFGAGMVATVNPCGILLVPSLVAYYLSRDETVVLTTPRRVGKALLLGSMATVGFVAIFALVGVIVGAGGGALATSFPFGGLVIGIALAVLGGWLALSGRDLGILAASQALGRVELRDNPVSLILFGVGYAICSLSCTLPIFLVVAGSALAAQGLAGAATQFVAYALGMGSVLTVVIVAAAFFQTAVARFIRALVPYVHRLAAAFLLGAGIYISHYWLAALGFLG